MQVISRTHVGLVRENNEDALLVREPSLFAVADGMGGYAGGADAAAITAACAKHSIASWHPRKNKLQDVSFIKKSGREFSLPDF